MDYVAVAKRSNVMKLLNDTIKLGKVSLKVVDMEKMVDFYSNGLGLKILSQDDKRTILGTDKIELVELVTDSHVRKYEKSFTGLYHLALLLPEENDLLAMIYFIQKNGVEISGAADHIFSQAIYLDDPENNGIEIYTDRPRNQWIYEDEGGLKGVSDPLDVETLHREFDGRVLSEVPADTIMGHVHLSLRDLDMANDFYINTMDFKLVMELMRAMFVSKQGYHHNLGMNTWTPVSQDNSPSDASGLNYFEIIVDNLDEIKEKLEGSQIDYSISDDAVTLRDGQGITIVLKA